MRIKLAKSGHRLKNKSRIVDLGPDIVFAVSITLRSLEDLIEGTGELSKLSTGFQLDVLGRLDTLSAKLNQSD